MNRTDSAAAIVTMGFDMLLLTVQYPIRRKSSSITVTTLTRFSCATISSRYVCFVSMVCAVKFRSVRKSRPPMMLDPMISRMT